MEFGGVLDKELAKIEAQGPNILVQYLIESAPKYLNIDRNDSNKNDLHLRFAKEIRVVLGTFTDEMNTQPDYVEAMGKCNHSELHVKTHHCGEYDVKVLVHEPKVLAGTASRRSLIWAHGGGVCAGSAKGLQGFLSRLAVHCNLVVYNVEYRLSPEVKCPNNIKDFYSCLKYVYSNAQKLGLDATRISIGGESGGGYICFGTMVLLAQNQLSHIVKLAVPVCPMVDDYSFTTDPLSMTSEERDSYLTMRAMWEMIAVDMEKQKQDPLLFPAKAKDELLASMPNTAIFTNEFDMFITETFRVAQRLKRANRLVEFVSIPGTKHASCIHYPALRAASAEMDAYRMVFEKYL